VRDADVVILLLGTRYGTPQSSGLSPTHEEYREAHGTKPVLTFVQTGIVPEPDEKAFIAEVSGWEDGGYRQPFDTPASLRAAVTRALHEWELSQQAGPVNEEELTARAVGLLPRASTFSAGSPLLHVAVAGALARQVLRPGDASAGSRSRSARRTPRSAWMSRAACGSAALGAIRAAEGNRGPASRRWSKKMCATASRTLSITPGGFWSASTRATG
jgi:hypothetical protein